MKVVFLEKAEWRIDDTSGYIKDEFGRKAEQDFRCKIRDIVRLLRRNPCLGPVEPLLAERPSTYRSVVVGTLNKIVYRVLDDRIEIADLWDCRREPQVQAEKVK